MSLRGKENCRVGKSRLLCVGVLAVGLSGPLRQRKQLSRESSKILSLSGSVQSRVDARPRWAPGSVAAVLRGQASALGLRGRAGTGAEHTGPERVPVQGVRLRSLHASACSPAKGSKSSVCLLG